jgi:protein-S-isoprenylcysteine O-methyltransferase Ste14
MQPLMLHNGIYQQVFVGAVILFALQQLPALWSTLQLRLGRGASSKDRGSYSALQILVAVGVVLGSQSALHMPRATITGQRPMVFFLGSGVAVLGSVISWAAVCHLGRCFTGVVAVRPDQPVVQSGLYHLIRHPSYLGQRLVFLGYALTLTNWISIPAVMVFVVPGYVYRIRVEEQALGDCIGAPYREYMARTYRLLPRDW